MAMHPQHNPSDGQPPIDPQAFYDASAEEQNTIGRFNLAIIGNTGVGKSSLVNEVFGRDLARVGHGLPVTKGIHYYHERSLGLWDFEGFEIGTHKAPAEQLQEGLDKIRQRPAEEHISVVWYCVLAQAARLTDADIDMIRRLHASGLPVIVVLTKVRWQKNPITKKYSADEDTEKFRDWLENPVALIDGVERPIDIPIEAVVLTSTQGKGGAHGLGELLTTTLALSPDRDKDAFRVAQRLNLPWKRDLARKAVATAVTAAGAAGAVPIPVSDAVALAPIQLSMMARIAVIYDLDMKSLLSAGAVAQLGVQISGQALARSFLKLIPGAGSVINASVAAALTAAMGEAWMRLCERIHQGDIDLNNIDNVWAEHMPTVATVIRKMVETRIARK